MSENPLGNTFAHVAILQYGAPGAQQPATFDGNRLQPLSTELHARGVAAVPVLYNDSFADDVYALLSGFDGVLIWVNPIEQERDRTILDALLKQVADDGILVSAHPDIIQKMGTKEVLVRTSDMSWGCDTHLYSTLQQMREQLPLRLNDGKARVLKQFRGNGGNGVWKVERHPRDASFVRARHAIRGSIEQQMPIDEFFALCEPYFTNAGRLIDQAYQERLTDGMVRCYLVQDKVAGFGHQAINALFPVPSGASQSDAPQPGPRLYYPPTQPEFQDIKNKMESEWLNALCRTLGIDTKSLPLIWDADFLYGPKTAMGEDTYVLCEINVSSVYPFPDAALEPLADATKEWLSK